MGAGVRRAGDLHDPARACAVLWRPGAQQERAVDPDPEPGGVLAGGGAVGAVRLQPGLHRGQCLHRRHRPGAGGGIGCFLDRRDLHQGRVHPRARVLRVPGRVRLHHLRAGGGCVRGAGEVCRGTVVHRAVVHLRLPADGAHGLVLPGPGCVHQRRSGGWRTGQVGLPVGQGRAGLRRRHRGAHQCRGRRPGRCVRDRQAHRLRPRGDQAAQPHPDHGRCVDPVVRLVRLQRRFRTGSRWCGGDRLRQHLPCDRSCSGGVDRAGMAAQGQAVAAWRGLRRGGGTGGDHPGGGTGGTDGCIGDGRDRRRVVPVGRQRPEAPARRG